MTQRKWITCFALVAVAFVAACGSDSITQPSGNLTTDQLQSMTSALSFLLGVSTGQPDSTLGELSRIHARTVMAVALPVHGSATCPEGGHIGTSGSISVDTAGNGVFALTDTLIGCAIKDNHSDIWTFTTKPTLAVLLVDSTNVHGDSIDISHSALTQTDAGTLQYSTGSLSGTCSVNVSIEYVVDRGMPTADSATFSLHTRGTLCGRSVSRDSSTTQPYTPPNFRRVPSSAIGTS